MPSPAAGITAFFIDSVRCCAHRARRYPSARGALVADVGRIVALRRRIEAELLALHQPAEVREVTRDHEQRQHARSR